MKKNSFFAMMGRMKYITRWGLMRNTLRESLSEHSFETAVIAHALAVIGKERYGRAVDPGEIAAAALFHDAPEILTGDLPTPVKYHNPDIRRAYQAVEQNAAQQLLGTLPDDLRPTYTALFAFEADRPEFYRYIKAADKISAYLKCVEERKSGSREFLRAEAQLLAALREMGMPEADDYMAQFAIEFEHTLDALQQEEN